jgi:hypothetical protein
LWFQSNSIALATIPPGGQGVFFDTLLKKHDIMKEKMTRNKILRIKA